MIKLRRASLAFISTLPLCVACGSDDAVEVIPPSGLPQDKLGKDLSVAEVQTFCEWQVDNIYYATQSEWCTFRALQETQTLSDCSGFRDTCLEADWHGFPEPDWCKGASKDDFGTDCNATVGELESCVRGIREGSEAFFSMLSCSEESRQRLTKDEPITTVPGCEKLSACPHLKFYFLGRRRLTP